MILQLSFFSYLSILGATPYLVPVVVVALGLLGGGVVGAVCGFAAGLLVDSLLLQTLGVSSLVLLSIGYLAGRYREGFEIRNKLVPALLAGGFTLLGATGFAAIELMLGVDAPVSLLVVREILVQSLLAIGLGFVVYPLLRRVLAPGTDRLRALGAGPVGGQPPAPAAPAAQPRGRALRHAGSPAPAPHADPRGRLDDGSRLARPADAEPVPASRRRSSAASPWSPSRSSSCASGTSRCSRATSTWPRPRTTRCASSPCRRRAARSSTATARSWSTTGPRSSCR